MEEIELLETPEEYKPKRDFKCILIVIALIILLFAFLFGFRYSSKPIIPLDEQPSPSSFILDDKYIVPIYNSSYLEKSSIISFLYILESSFKSFAINSGIMSKDKYLRMSYEYVNRYLENTCKSNSNRIPCNRSFFSKSHFDWSDITDIVDFLANFGLELSPYSNCPSSDQCNTIISPNPLQFSINNFSYLKGIEHIKKRIVSSSHPLLLSMPNILSKQLFFCDQFLVSRAQCQYGSIVPLAFSHITTNDISEVFNIEKEFYMMNLVSMPIVGYSDTIVISNQYSSSYEKIDKGGFIIKVPIGNPGHSLSFLSGNIDSRSEEQLCPNADDPFNWIPASLSCMEEYSNPRICSHTRSRIYSQGATELVCTNKFYCDMDFRYVLMGDLTSSKPLILTSDLGVQYGVLIQFNESGSLQLLDMIHVPFGKLNECFSRLISFKNDKSHCGYSILPYSLLDKIDRASSIYNGEYAVYDIDIKWKDVKDMSTLRGSLFESGSIEKEI